MGGENLLTFSGAGSGIGAGVVEPLSPGTDVGWIGCLVSETCRPVAQRHRGETRGPTSGEVRAQARAHDPEKATAATAKVPGACQKGNSLQNPHSGSLTTLHRRHDDAGESVRQADTSRSTTWTAGGPHARSGNWLIFGDA